MDLTGEADGPPVKVGVAVTDVLTGLHAHGAIVSALFARERAPGRPGQWINTSLLETQVATLINAGSSYLVGGKQAQRWGTAHASIVPYQGFRTADDKYFVVAVGGDSQWRRFCELLGATDLRDDERFATNKLRVQNREVLVPLLSELMARRTQQELAALDWESGGIGAGPINDLEQVYAHPQVIERDMVVELDHPTAGAIRMAGLPVKMTGTPCQIVRPPPLLGQHTMDVCRELGFSQHLLDDMHSKGILHTWKSK